jgi:essential nuclear protein 1
MPKKVHKREGVALRHDPLEVQLNKDERARKGLLEEASVINQRNLEKKRPDTDDGDVKAEDLIPEKLSGKILKLAKEQQIEVERERTLSNRGSKDAGKLTVPSKSKVSIDDDDEDDDAALDDDDELEDGADDVIHKGDYVENVEISQDDEDALAMFMGTTTAPRIKLADLILDKIREKEEALANGGTLIMMDAGEAGANESLSPKIVQCYQRVGQFMQRYSAGKVPKAFKIIPSLTNWEEVLYVTRPDQWSCQAVFVATRLFASNLNAKSAQRFFNIILLDRVIEDIGMNKRLNYHLYLSLKKVGSAHSAC